MPSEFSQDQMDWSVMEAIDLAERMMLRPVFTGEVAYNIKHFDKAQGPFVELTYHESEMTPERKQTLREYNAHEIEGGWETISAHKVPIIIRVLKNRYKFFENTDMMFYRADDMRTPNPFDAYWKARGLLK